jgi:hypothetical protein
MTTKFMESSTSGTEAPRRVALETIEQVEASIVLDLNKIETTLIDVKARTDNIELNEFNPDDVVFKRDIIPRRGIFVGTGRALDGFDDFPVTIIGADGEGSVTSDAVYAGVVVAGETEPPKLDPIEEWDPAALDSDTLPRITILGTSSPDGYNARLVESGEYFAIEKLGVLPDVVNSYTVSFDLKVRNETAEPRFDIILGNGSPANVLNSTNASDFADTWTRVNIQAESGGFSGVTLVFYDVVLEISRVSVAAIGDIIPNVDIRNGAVTVTGKLECGDTVSTDRIAVGNTTLKLEAVDTWTITSTGGSPSVTSMVPTNLAGGITATVISSVGVDIVDGVYTQTLVRPDACPYAGEYTLTLWLRIEEPPSSSEPRFDFKLGGGQSIPIVEASNLIDFFGTGWKRVSLQATRGEGTDIEFSVSGMSVAVADVRITGSTNIQDVSISNGTITATGALTCGTIDAGSNELTCGAITCGEIDADSNTLTCGAITCGELDAGSNTLTCGTVNCGEIAAGSNTLTCGTVNCGEIAAGTNALTCGKVNCGEIAAGTNALTCGKVTCGTIDADSSTLTCGGIVVKKVVDIPADLDQWTVTNQFGATATNSNSGPDASLAILVSYSSGDAILELDMNTDIGSHGAGRFVLTFQMKLPSTAVAGGSLAVRLPGVTTTAIGSSTDITPFIDQWAEVTCDIDVSAGIDSKLFFSFTDFPAEVSEIRLRYPVSVTIGRPISDIGIIIDSDLETNALTCGAITCGELDASSNTLTCGTVNCGEIAAGSNTLTCGKVNCGEIAAGSNTLTCGTVNCGEIAAGSSTLTCGKVNCGEIAAGTNALTCGTVNCGEIAAGESALTCGTVNCGEIAAGESALTCGAVTCSGNVSFAKSLFQGPVPANYRAYPYRLTPVMKRFRIDNIASNGGTFSLTLESGFGQAMALEGAERGGVYMISVMEENSDYNAAPPWSGVWLIELSNYDFGKIRILARLNEDNLVADIQSPKNFVVRNTNNQEATGALILTQLQVA